MSQLGMMVIAVGLSSYNIALFHLVNHAFYKALLFLGAGAVIHAVYDNQDFRKYGGLKQFLPLTYSVMLIASLSLVAFPFMTGFYSKDFILESAFGKFCFSSIVVYYIATIGAIFTTLYSVKVLYLTFLTSPNGPIKNYRNAHEGNIYMSLPLVILAVFSIFFGYITKDMFIGLGSDLFSDNSIFIHPIHEIMLDTEFGVITLYKLLPLLFTVILSILSLTMSEFISYRLAYFKLSRLGYNIFSFFNLRFFIELFYNKYITATVFILGGQTTKVLDRGSIELIGPYGLEKGLMNISSNLAKLDTGTVTTYALYILVGLIFYNLIPYLYSTYNLLLLIIIITLTLFNINRNVIYNVNKDNTLKSSIFDFFFDYFETHFCNNTNLKDKGHINFSNTNDVIDPSEPSSSGPSGQPGDSNDNGENNGDDEDDNNDNNSVTVVSISEDFDYTDRGSDYERERELEKERELGGISTLNLDEETEETSRNNDNNGEESEGEESEEEESEDEEPDLSEEAVEEIESYREEVRNIRTDELKKQATELEDIMDNKVDFRGEIKENIKYLENSTNTFIDEKSLFKQVEDVKRICNHYLPSSGADETESLDRYRNETIDKLKEVVQELKEETVVVRTKLYITTDEIERRENNPDSETESEENSSSEDSNVSKEENLPSGSRDSNVGGEENLSSSENEEGPPRKKRR
jgi:NADH-ubiquinone oxidoreductase chain 5